MCEMNKVDFPNDNRPPVRSSDPAVRKAAQHAREQMAHQGAKPSPAKRQPVRKAAPAKSKARKTATPKTKFSILNENPS